MQRRTGRGAWPNVAVIVRIGLDGDLMFPAAGSRCRVSLSLSLPRRRRCAGRKYWSGLESNNSTNNESNKIIILTWDWPIRPVVSSSKWSPTAKDALLLKHNRASPNPLALVISLPLFLIFVPAAGTFIPLVGSYSSDDLKSHQATPHSLLFFPPKARPRLLHTIQRTAFISRCSPHLN